MSPNDSKPAAADGFFERLWQQDDFWEFDRSDYERERLSRTVAIAGDRRYHRGLEIGCGAGHMTRLFAPRVDSLLAVDIAEAAIAKARARGVPPGVEYRVADAMELDLRREGPFDLVVMSEAVYYLGWTRSFFEVAFFARTLLEATAPGGHLLLANTLGHERDDLHRPWIVGAYRDLFLNAGYETEREDVFRGRKNGVDFEVPILLLRPGTGGALPQGPLTRNTAT